MWVDYGKARTLKHKYLKLLPVSHFGTEMYQTAFEAMTHQIYYVFIMQVCLCANDFIFKKE